MLDSAQQLGRFFFNALSLADIGDNPDASVFRVAGVNGSTIDFAPEQAAILAFHFHPFVVSVVRIYDLRGQFSDRRKLFGGWEKTFDRFSGQFLGLLLK